MTAHRGPHRPHRFEDDRYEVLWQPVFFSGTSYRRRPLLLSGDVPHVLRDALLEAAAAHQSEVIAYSIMPDHFHYLCCVSEEGGNVREMADWLKRVSGQRISRLGVATPIWQRSYYDRHIRPHEKLSRVVEYILNNPVEGGLCGQAEDWEHAAFFGYPWLASEPD